MNWLYLILLLAVAGLAYIRLAPSDPARWHQLPAAASTPQGNGWLLRDTGGNAPAVAFAATPAAVLTALHRIALASPRTSVLAGSPEAGHVTYVTRSRLMGFPDYTSVSAEPAAGGTRLMIDARQRFGSQDMGVNRARVETWVAAVQRELD